MQPTLIDQGLNLMLFGMGTVFIFLTILVFATTLMSSMVSRFNTDEPTNEQVAGSTQAGPSPRIVEAIHKAITAHQNA